MASRSALLLVAAGALALVAGEVDCQDGSCLQSDETPLLQVHSASASQLRKGVPKMPVNGPGQPPRPPPRSPITTVDVHNTVVVIPGNVIIGENVTAGSGNNLNISNQLQALLEDATQAAADSAASTAGKAAQEIQKNSVELPRFVTDNVKVWLQDENGKHLLTPSRDCTMCGCFYDENAAPNPDGNYDVLSQADLDAIADGDHFSCQEHFPPLWLLQELGIPIPLTREAMHAAHKDH